MHSDPVANVAPALFAKVRENAPDRALLLISDQTSPLVPEWITDTLSSTEALAAPPPESRNTCGLILTPWVKAERLDSVIAHLRDFLSMELYVLHPGDSMEQTRQMGALGLRCLEAFSVDGQSWGLNHFSLKTYKKTPHWLNSRFWANPQLWNKFRW